MKITTNTTFIPMLGNILPRKSIKLSLPELRLLREALEVCEGIRDKVKSRHGPDAECEADTASLGLSELLAELNKHGGIDLE